MPWLPGSCHCGDVRFEVDADLSREQLLDCNCSICAKKGFLHLIVPPERFRLLTSPEALTTYTFGEGRAQHRFCTRCGVHPFYSPRSHPGHIDVNLRVLEGVDLSKLRIEAFDGRDNWEQSRAALPGAAG